MNIACTEMQEIRLNSLWKKQKNKSRILENHTLSSTFFLSIFCLLAFLKKKTHFWTNQISVSESTLRSWKSHLPQPLSWNGKISVNFQPFFDWMNLPPSCTTRLPQVTGWCSVAWNKQIEKGTSWHLTLTRMQLTATLPASYNNQKMGGERERDRERGEEELEGRRKGGKRAGKGREGGFGVGGNSWSRRIFSALKSRKHLNQLQWVQPYGD